MAVTTISPLQQIEYTIKSFSSKNLYESSINLFHALGYQSSKTQRLTPNTFDEFLDNFNISKNAIDKEKALVKQWKQIEFIFQIADTEITRAHSLFDNIKYDHKEYQSFLFFSIQLKESLYKRGDLVAITRELNKPFKMPVIILFHYGDKLTLSIIDRRLHKKDSSKDVLEKVTLIKDIDITTTHRAHLDILKDLSLNELEKKFTINNFVQLHEAWKTTLSVSELNKKFFKELSNWYFSAMNVVSFPDDVEKKKDVRNATNLIRLITRVIFIWFIKEKQLIPNELFRHKYIDKILKDFNKNKKSQNYYNAILQNLFFGTLNQKRDERKFAKDGGNIKINNAEYGVKNLFRYADLFAIPEKEVLAIFKDVPFLNGGLFDCLDKPNDEGKIIYVDGYSRNPKKQARVPDYIFFGEEKEVDLNEIYGTKNKKYFSRGLINLLESYKFTIAENTPIEEEIALDPELLGKVFENLLASYNPETQSTARKQTGSFYTPREIVNYMVDESLLEYIKQNVKNDSKDFEARLRDVFSYSEKPNPFNETETQDLIESINNCKILDPACGSGAFPMGILHKKVHILQKLDPENKQWKEAQRKRIIGEEIRKLEQDKKAIEGLSDKQVREKALGAVKQRLEELENIFNKSYNFDDYSRKLYLIENCIYGIDIQPIAVQIAKLRFFISLIIDQKVNKSKDNFGVRSLPNLETKFVAANTLIGLDKPPQTFLRNPDIEVKENELKELRHKYFTANTRKEKIALQKQDKKLRLEIAKLLENDGWETKVAKQIVAFDPYDQNASSGWFDPEWMFGLTSGFDIVIGNPPYKVVKREEQNQYVDYSTLACGDLYAYFFEKSLRNLLKTKGSLAFITASLFIKGIKFESLRSLLEKQLQLHSLEIQGDRVFENVQMPTVVVIGLKSENKNNKWSFEDYIPNNSVIKKIESRTKPLSSISTIMRGFEIGRDHVSNSGDVKFITGSDVSKWAIKKYSYISKKTEAKYMKNEQFFKGERILIRETGSELTVIYLNSKLYCNRSLYSIKICDINLSVKYITALLNSRLFQFYYESKFKSETDLFPKIRIAQVKELPIKIAKNQNTFITLSDKIITEKKSDHNSDTSKHEKQIDVLVYKLYNLTEEEIAIVEGRVNEN
jgi:adenine-specific DNA-methyltransferase